LQCHLRGQSRVLPEDGLPPLRKPSLSVTVDHNPPRPTDRKDSSFNLDVFLGVVGCGFCVLCKLFILAFRTNSEARFLFWKYLRSARRIPLCPFVAFSALDGPSLIFFSSLFLSRPVPYPFLRLSLHPVFPLDEDQIRWVHYRNSFPSSD